MMRKILAGTACSIVLLTGVAFGAQKPLPALDDHEAGALRMVLADAKPGTITIACGGDYCSDLAISVAMIFAQKRWTVVSQPFKPTASDVPHGQFSIPVKEGIRVTACGVTAKAMLDALKWSTARQVMTIDTGGCPQGGAPEIMLTIGAPEG